MKKSHFILWIMVFVKISFCQIQHSINDNQIQMFVNVWGEVENPGRILVDSNYDLIKIISVAGGPNALAELSKIKITRIDPVTKKINTQPVNLDAVLKGTSPAGNIQIYPEDTIYIPKKWFAGSEKMNLTMGILCIVNLIAICN